jgi:DHA1 family bicyclomycin/chloramphenicol resistance-like MFS transporter
VKEKCRRKDLDTSDFESAFATGRVLQYVSSGLFAFIAGVLADYFGRKQPIIIGLIVLGGSYAFVGLATSPLSWMIFLISSGVAWGMLMVSLGITAFGDLASHGSKERVFVIATIIPLMAHVSFSSVTEAFSLYAPANVLSTVLSIILFVSVLPVLRASETLPENKLRARRMKKYFRKLEEVVQESKKTG